MDALNTSELRALIKIYFPQKGRCMCRTVNSYQLKSRFERLSGRYVSNDMVIAAFEKAGFRSEKCGVNKFFNVTPNDARTLHRTIRTKYAANYFHLR